MGEGKGMRDVVKTRAYALTQTLSQREGINNLHCYSRSQGSARYSPDQQPRDRVDDKRNQKKNQPELNQRTQVDVGCGFGKFVRDHRRQRVRRLKERGANLR